MGEPFSALAVGSVNVKNAGQKVEELSQVHIQANGGMTFASGYKNGFNPSSWTGSKAALLSILCGGVSPTEPQGVPY